MMTKTQAEHLAELVHEIRPTWDTHGVMAALAKVRNRDLATIVIATTRAATNQSYRTPAVIALDGDHWQTVSTNPADRPVRRPPTRAEECRTHQGQYATHCAGCAADRKTFPMETGS